MSMNHNVATTHGTTRNLPHTQLELEWSQGEPESEYLKFYSVGPRADHVRI